MGHGLHASAQAFNDELMGMKKGQTKEFDIDVPAEADATVMTQALVGKTAKIHFEVEVKVVKKKVVPELTDEWTKEKLASRASRTCAPASPSPSRPRKTTSCRA